MADHQYITATELCDQLKMSRNTISKLIHDPEAFPNAILVSNRWRIPQADVDAFIEHRKGKGRRRRVAG